MATRRRTSRKGNGNAPPGHAELGAIVEALAVLAARDPRSGAQQAIDDVLDRLGALDAAKVGALFAHVETPNGRQPLWRRIPGDDGPLAFEMGSRDRDRSDNEGPVAVQFSQPWWLAAVPVTLAQYECMVGRHEAHRTEWKKAPESDCPVTRVSWFEARLFARWLERQRLRLPGAFASALAGVPSGHRFGLPTEAQWEFSCRARTTTRFYSGDRDEDLGRVGWFDGNSSGRIQRVAQKPANDWGLFDMHGNVWEWCEDWFDELLRGGGDPLGPSSGRDRVLRGGCYGDGPRWCRSAYRNWYVPDGAGDGGGFRLCLCAPELGRKIEDRR